MLLMDLSSTEGKYEEGSGTKREGTLFTSKE